MGSLTASDLVRIHRTHSPSTAAKFMLIAVFAAATVVVASPLEGRWPVLALGGAALATIAWVLAMRRPGQRGNDYSPLKTDDELATTPFSWRDLSGPVLIMLVLVAPLQFSNVVDSWIFAWGLGALSAAVAWWVLRDALYRPQHYVSPESLAAAHPSLRLDNERDLLLGYFYAAGFAPGGRQISFDATTRALAPWGLNEQAVRHAVNELSDSGAMVILRERRGSGEDKQWLTLTEAGRDEMLQSFPV